MRSAPGFSVVELVIAVALLSLLMILAVPGLLHATAGLRVEQGAAEVATVLRTARAAAMRYGQNAGAKFRTDAEGRVTFTLYLDGDGDGVLSADIDSGVDEPLGPARELEHLGPEVRFGFPEGPAPRDPGDHSRRLDRLTDPIRFNRSDIAAFSSWGASTPGTLYLTDGRETLVAVRVLGRSGRIRLLGYDAEEELWRRL